MEDTRPGERQLSDAAVVHAARCRVEEAITRLAAQPFEPAAAVTMRQAMAAARAARSALHRLRQCASQPDGGPLPRAVTVLRLPACPGAGRDAPLDAGAA